MTLAFGLLRAGSSGTWTAATVAVAVAAVGLGAALNATPTFRTAVLGFEAAAVAFGVAGLAIEGHLVPGTVIGGFVLLRLAQTSVAEFCALPVLVPGGAPPSGWQTPVVGAPVAAPGSVPPWAAQGAPIAPPAWPAPAPPSGPWPPAVPVAPGYATAPQGPLPVPPAVPAQQGPSPLESEARQLAQAAPLAVERAPEPPQPSAPRCMTILPG